MGSSVEKMIRSAAVTAYNFGFEGALAWERILGNLDMTGGD